MKRWTKDRKLFCQFSKKYLIFSGIISEKLKMQSSLKFWDESNGIFLIFPQIFGTNHKGKLPLFFNNLLYKHQCHKDIYKRNVYNMCITIYNKLPEELKELNGNIFRNKIRGWLLEKCFYTVNEYLEIWIVTNMTK